MVVFGGAKKQIAAIVEAEHLVETPGSRGPRHFVATTERDGVEVTIEIRPQQLYRMGEPVDRSPQRVFRRFGLDPRVDLLVRPPGAHSTRADPPRGRRVGTGDESFDARFEVLSVDDGDVGRLLDDKTRGRLLEMDDVAELRIDGGQASLHLTFSKLDHEPIRHGIDFVAALG